ncbi:MAG: IclR family transcriptional regulator [Pontiella sp.]|nr:IclR family transcriptional regulator [Pontiella sp.]NNJ70953.1 IclR family transcriptional regulator [Kiritimatiellales bacterium]
MSSKYQVPNVDRALTMMELLKENPKGMTVTEMVGKLGFSQTSVYRISMTLLDRGFFMRDDKTKKFRISNKLFSVSTASTCDVNIAEAAAPSLRQLRNSTKETTLLGILQPEKGRGVSIMEYPGLHPFRFVHDIGEPIILHVGAPGKALLAFLPEDEQNEIISRLKLKKYTQHTITDKAALKKELATIRERGYGAGLGEWMEEMHCISAPVLDGHDYPVAVIWITGPATRMTIDAIPALGRKVMSCAAEISKQIQNEII